MDRKIKVLVVPSDRFGCGLWRSVKPHTKLNELYGDEFDIDIEYEPNWLDLPSFDKYDIIHFHKGLYQDMEPFRNALKYFKEHNIVTIMDLDDHWEVGQFHPMFQTARKMKMAEKITGNFGLVDYVTTTTEIFANKIKKWNKNVFVFPNAIDPNDSQFSTEKEQSDKIRFGFVMGSSHKRDMEQFFGTVSTLPEDVLNKIQIVLCGYDLRGQTYVQNPDGTITTRPIKPTESVWFEYERNVTNDFKIVSDEYRNFLFNFLPNAQYPKVNEEPYRREWTKDVNSFGTHYKYIDVLIAPLDTNQFNEVKSELKFVEAGFTNTALICSDFGPYHLVGKSIFERGGGINENGNCVLIDPAKKHKAWSKAITRLTRNPELIDKLKYNLHEFVKDEYNLDNVTKRRAEWYKSIIKKED